MSEWPKTTIGELISEKGGSIKTGPFGTVLKACEYTPEGVPLISVREVGYGSLRVDKLTPCVPEEVTKRLPEYLLSSGDIVFGRKGAIDRSAHVNNSQDGWFLGSDGIRLRLPKSCDSRFMSYQLQTQETRTWLLQHATGTTMASLNQKVIERIPIVLPLLSEQRAIAYILGTLDDKIELNRQMNDTLESMARALFKSWFVDFDPVRAKVEGRDTGLPKEIAELFPDSFEETELGEVPRGWQVKKVEEIAKCIKGKSYKSEHLQESQTALVTLKSFARGGGYRADGLKAYTGDYKTEQTVQPGELVIACTDVTQAADVIGRPAIVESSDKFSTMIASLDVLIVRPSVKNITVPFLYCLFKTDRFADHTYAHSTGTTVLHLSKEAVPSYKFACPPEELHKHFASLTIPIFTRIDIVEQESRTLADLRDTLLPKLISGELRIKDAEHIIGGQF